MDRHYFQTIFCEDGSVEYTYNQWFFIGKTGTGRRYYETRLPHAIGVGNLHDLRTAFVKEEEDYYQIGIYYPDKLRYEPRNFWLSYNVLGQWNPNNLKLKWEDPGSASIQGKIIFNLCFPINQIVTQAKLRLKIDEQITDQDVIIEENTISTEFDCEKEYEDCKWEIILEKISNPSYAEDELDELNPTKFEELIASLLISMGYRKVHLTPITGDKGRDIECELPTKFGNAISCIVECKSTKGSIKAPDVRKLAGAIAEDEFEFGIFVTLGSFTLPAYKEFAIGRPKGPIGIELVDRYELIELLNKHGFLK